MKTLKTGLSKCETSDDRCRTLNPEPLSTGLSLAADLFLRSFPEVGFENMLVFLATSLFAYISVRIGTHRNDAFMWSGTVLKCSSFAASFDGHS